MLLLHYSISFLLASKTVGLFMIHVVGILPNTAKHSRGELSRLKKKMVKPSYTVLLLIICGEKVLLFHVYLHSQKPFAVTSLYEIS